MCVTWKYCWSLHACFPSCNVCSRGTKLGLLLWSTCGKVHPPPQHSLWGLPGYLLGLACLCVQLLQSCPTLCNPVDCSPQASLSMGFSRQEYRSGLPCPSSGDLPGPGMESTSPDSSALQAGSLPLNRQGSLRGALSSVGGYEVSALNYNSIP